MKKYVAFVLLMLPTMAFAVPSVRMLGGQPALTAAAGSKITPVKKTTSSSDDSATSSARVGSLRAKSKAVSLISSENSNASSSRFPVITPAHSYNSVLAPKTGNTPTSAQPSTANVDLMAIIDALTQKIENDYYVKEDVYNKTEVYNKDEVENLINENIPEIDDARFDAIRTTDPRIERGVDAPDGYVYIWVEEN